MPQFYEDSIQGVLANGVLSPVGPLDGDFFQNTAVATNLVPNLVPAVGPARGGAALSRVQERLMNALGSNQNSGVFVIAWNDLNCYKAIVGCRAANPSPHHLELQICLLTRTYSCSLGVKT
jgi:hypothetical protein